MVNAMFPRISFVSGTLGEEIREGIGRITETPSYRVLDGVDKSVVDMVGCDMDVEKSILSMVRAF
jgi:hypothetical protein